MTLPLSVYYLIILNALRILVFSKGLLNSVRTVDVVVSIICLANAVSLEAEEDSINVFILPRHRTKVFMCHVYNRSFYLFVAHLIRYLLRLKVEPR